MHACNLKAGTASEFKRLNCGNQADLSSARDHDQSSGNKHCNVRMQLGDVGHIEDKLYFDPYISLCMPKFMLTAVP